MYSHILSKHTTNLSSSEDTDFDDASDSSAIFESESSSDSSVMLTDDDVEREMCQICGKMVVNIGQHNMRRHSIQKLQWECEECGKKFIHRSGLISHATVHTGDRPFLCLQCGKCFRTKGMLKQHQTVHQTETPFSCGCCDKQFKTAKFLKNHMQAVHDDAASVGDSIKPLDKLQCPLCAAKFGTDYDALKDHVFEDHVTVDGIVSNPSSRDI